MIYWVLLFAVVLSLSFVATYTNISRSTRVVLLVTICVSLIYFSAFRDGLGTDYYTYMHRILYAPISKQPVLLSEPIFNLIVSLIRSTSLSHVFYFLMMAIITIIPTIYTYNKFRNFFIIVVIYLTLPILYSGSFNIVRQTGAAAVFLFSLQYIVNRNFLKYFCCIFVAFLLHKSAIILLPFYWLRTDSFNRVFMVVVLLFSLIPTLLTEVILSAGPYLELVSYDTYFNYESNVVDNASVTQIIFHLLVIPIFIYKNKILKLKHSKYYIISFKLFIWYLFFTNFAVTGMPISYRLALYFAPFIPIIFSLLIECFQDYYNRRVIEIIVVSLFFTIGLYYFYLNFQNPFVIPEKILHINSIVQF